MFVVVVMFGVVLGEKAACIGDVSQMVERSLSMREVQGSIPCFSRRM